MKKEKKKFSRSNFVSRRAYGAAAMAEANAERRDEDCEQNLTENFASCCHIFPNPLDLLLGFREREEDGGLTKIFIKSIWGQLLDSRQKSILHALQARRSRCPTNLLHCLSCVLKVKTPLFPSTLKSKQHFQSPNDSNTQISIN